MMYDLFELFLALMWGGGLGLMFFGGLWLTLAQLPRASQPALLVFGSFIARTAAVLLGLYPVIRMGWQPFAAAMIGFVLMRMLLTRWLGVDVQREKQVRYGDQP